MSVRYKEHVVHIFSLPYHSGRFAIGMGKGPKRLIEDFDLVRILEGTGYHIRMQEVGDPVDVEPEIARVIELDRRLAMAVGQAIKEGEFPLVLAGNCNSCLGTCAGVGNEQLGVVWFDAHADFDTPDDNLSGFFDVMGLSILTGSCWKALRETIPGFVPLDERNVTLVGTRDLEPYQWTRLKNGAVNCVPGERIRSAGATKAILPALDALRRRASDLYLHIDLDCLDTSEGKANCYAAPGGLKLVELEEAVAEIFQRFNVRAAAVTAYDPDFDSDGRVGRAAIGVIEAIVCGDKEKEGQG